MRQVIQTLLAERFGLVVHRETRRLTGYALVIGKGVARMQRVSDTETARGEFQSLKTGEIVAVREPMAELALKLSGQINLPVVDKTGLSGRYNFSLRWSNYDLPADPAKGFATDPDLDRPSLFGALQELGLKLERQPVPVETIVVERAERPTEN